MSEENDNKPNLDVPEHLEYSDEHVWVDASTEPAMVGITEYAADQLGELVYIDLPEVGTEVKAGFSKSNLRMTSRDCFPPRNTPTSWLSERHDSGNWMGNHRYSLKNP